jgi:hypothetical protein
MARNYQELEYRILEILVENGRNSNELEVANSLSVSKEQLNVFLSNFYDNKWIGRVVGGGIQLLPKGIEAFGKWNSSYSTQAGGDIYETHNYGNPVIQIGGQGNTQNVVISHTTNNPEFDSAIKALLEAINTSNLSNDDKEEYLRDVQTINNLALKEPSPQIVERAKSKIDYLTTAIKATDLAVKIAPYIAPLYAYFESLIK